MEFIKLINLLIGNNKNRFTTKYDEFVTKFMNSEYNFSKYGKSLFQNKIKGLISYLNRSFDPRQFAQPIFYKVHVPISSTDINEDVLWTITDNCDELTEEYYQNLL